MSDGTVFSFRQALKNLKGDAPSQWREITAEFDTAVLPVVRPSFHLEPGEEIFTIGSCFARNIESHLARLGCRIPMLEFSLPPEEWHGLPNQALNKFTPPSFRQALEWTAAVADRDGRVDWSDCEPIAFDCGDDLYFDLDLTARTPVARERFLERRQQVFDVMRSAFSASCVIMTPGLIEGWRDRQTGLFMSGAGLKHKKVLASGDRLELVVLDYDRCFADMLASVDLIRARNPACRMLITTSPVPLSATFSGQDIRIANSYSKSVLRAVCGAVAAARPNIDYFPSYESVTLTNPEEVWHPDRIHVADAFVGRIVSRLAETYFRSVDPVRVHGQRAATALAAGDLQLAQEEAEAVLAIAPDDADARILLVDVLLKRRDGQRAKAEIEALPAAVQALAPVKIRLAQAVATEDPRQAAVIALEACRLSDADRDAFLWTNKALRMAKAPLDEREALLREGATRFPQQVHIRTALAQLLEQAGRASEALAELRGAQSEFTAVARDRQMLSEYIARLEATLPAS